MELHSAGETPRPRFDYRGRHRYLVSLDTAQRAQPFTSKDLVLRVLAVLREQSFRHHFEVHVYCFLPAKLILLVQGRADDSHMKTFLSAFRAASNEDLQSLLGHALWKRTYRERVLRKTEETRNVMQDILQTPVREGLVPSPDRHEFQGSFVSTIFPRGRTTPEQSHYRKGQPGLRGKRGIPPSGKPRGPWKPKRKN